MNASTGSDRRYFPRVNYRAHATLLVDDKRWPVHILDLSFNGALAALIHKHDLQSGCSVVLNIDTEEGETIKMQGKLSHLKEHYLGLECRATGIDNQARLRELLERNKTRENLANRSYAALMRDHDLST